MTSHRLSLAIRVIAGGKQNSRVSFGNGYRTNAHDRTAFGVGDLILAYATDPYSPCSCGKGVGAKALTLAEAVETYRTSGSVPCAC
jgi:hypothetical protein